MGVLLIYALILTMPLANLADRAVHHHDHEHDADGNVVPLDGDSAHG